MFHRSGTVPNHLENRKNLSPVLRGKMTDLHFAINNAVGMEGCQIADIQTTRIKSIAVKILTGNLTCHMGAFVDCHLCGRKKFSRRNSR